MSEIKPPVKPKAVQFGEGTLGELDCFQCFPPLTNKDKRCIRLVFAGEANAEQQRHAILVIMQKMGRLYDIQFRPGEPDVTAFMNGRAFVANRIMSVLQLPLENLLTEEN